jgi:DNA-directed RNA polymerase subunit RPC12/RpoP
MTDDLHQSAGRQASPTLSSEPCPETVEAVALRPCWTCRGKTFVEITHSSQEEGWPLFRCVNCKAIYPNLALNTRTTAIRLPEGVEALNAFEEAVREHTRDLEYGSARSTQASLAEVESTRAAILATLSSVPLADQPCDTRGPEDLEPGCCPPCRARSAFSTVERADDWRCINCKHIVPAYFEPTRCPSCSGRIFAHVGPSSTVPAVDEGLAAALEDCRTHRAAWRKALLSAKEDAAVIPPDIDDKAYWQHEIDAFDRTFAALTLTKDQVKEPTR